MRLAGARFFADKTGLIRYTEPWEVHTLLECASFIPANVLGLPIVERAAEEFGDVATWKLVLTYEGMTSSEGVNFESSEAVEVEIDGSMSGDPIQSHPNFAVLKVKFGWNTAKEEFAETLPTTSGQQTALSGSKTKSRRNPLHGEDSYLAVGAVFRVTYTTRNPPNDVLEGIGTVVERPPGWGLLNIAHPRGRNWLKLAPRVRLRGNAGSYAAEWMLSGPNGWIRDVYGAAQLALGGGSSPGLATGGLSTGSL